MVLSRLGTFIYDRLKAEKKEEFTNEDIMRWTGHSYGNAVLKSELFTKVGILELFRQEGRKLFFRFSPQFQDRENLELLAGVKELQERAGYSSAELEPLVSIIKDKIALILDAKEKLNIDTRNFGDSGPDLRKKFLIAISYPGLIELFRSFSAIILEKGENIGVYKYKMGDILKFVFPGRYIEDVLVSQGIWNLFLDYSADPAVQRELRFPLRRTTAFSVLRDDAGLETDWNAIFKDLRPECQLQPGEIPLAGLNKLVSPGGFMAFPFSAELYQKDAIWDQGYNQRVPLPYNPAEYGLSLLEAFIAHRNSNSTHPLYDGFKANQKAVVKAAAEAINMLSSVEKEVMILRVVKGFSLARVEEILNLPREQIRIIETRAQHKLRHFFDGMQPQPQVFLQNIEAIFQQVHSILFPPP
jgi:hypothetical protein